MDRASQVLVEGLPVGKPPTYVALAKWGNVPYSTLNHRAHGRPSIQDKARSQQYLTPEEETALARYLIQRADLGYPVPIKQIPSLAFIMASRRSTTDKPIKPPGKNWPKSFERRQPALKSRKVKAVDWNRHDNNIYDKVTHWFDVIEKVFQDPDILPRNVFNMDETGIMLSMLGSVKVLVGENDSRNYRGAGVKRTMVTAIECISADGRSLDPLIIWPASTHRDNWTTYLTPGWHYACSESGYTDSKISLEWLKRVFDPQAKAQANSKPRVLICDGFGCHETLEILEFCFSNNMFLCRIPSHTSHKLQPCDVGVFGPLKAAYHDEVEQLYRVGANTVGKEHFTRLYSLAREKALTPRNIKAGWGRSGLYPFNPERVLKDIRKPLANITVPKLDEMEIGTCPCPCPQDIGLSTPVTAEALKSLRSLIERDTHALDNESKRRLEKFAKAAQISFAERALLEDDNQLLFEQNNEAKHRRSVKSIVVGKAKVMSYKDIEEARAELAEKEQATMSKGKRGRKRKSTLPVAPKSKRVRSELEVAEDEIAAEGMEYYFSVLRF